MDIDNLTLEGIDRIIVQDLSLFRTKIRTILLKNKKCHESISSIGQYNLSPFFSIYKSKELFVKNVLKNTVHEYVLINHKTKELFFINSDIKEFFSLINDGSIDFDILRKDQKIQIDTFINLMIKHQFVQANFNSDLMPNFIPITYNYENIVQTLDQFKCIHTIVEDYNKSIFLLENNLSGEKYILKCLNNIKNQIQVDIFFNEINILKKLNKCHFISKIYVYDPERYYVIIEYINGIDLGEYLFYNSITLSEKLDLIYELVKLLAYLHSENVVHGDIHIDQFRLNEEGAIFLLDFGLAQDLSIKKSTNYTISGGSYEYLEPECIIPEPFNFHIPSDNYKCSEVYRIGVLLYYIIYEKYPFSDISWRSLYHSKTVKNIELTTSTEKGEFIPNYIVQMLKKTLDIEPNERFQSAKEMYSYILKYK